MTIVTQSASIKRVRSPNNLPPYSNWKRILQPSFLPLDAGAEAWPNPFELMLKMKLTRKSRKSRARKDILEAGYKHIAILAYNASLERQRLMQSKPQAPSLPSAKSSRKYVKLELESSPNPLLSKTSVLKIPSHSFNDIRAFLSKCNYENPLVLDSLEKSNFTKYELWSMKGLDLLSLASRFASLLAVDCRRPAQLECLGFAVMSASSTTWAMLNDTP